MVRRFFAFLVINFAALGIGSLFTGEGVPSEWYQELDKAPWTPPGRAFGWAWSTIMVCFAFYMAFAWTAVPRRRALLGLFIFQWVLNVSWNVVFFGFHAVAAGLIVIVVLTLLTGYFLLGYRDSLRLRSLLVLPYFLWLIVASSLNYYILVNN